MSLLLLSFIAGVLTVLAPCILPLLPVVIGAGVNARDRFTTVRVVGSLSLSIIAFTFVLKVSTIFIAIHPSFWTYLSGTMIVLVALTFIFPTWWGRVPGINRLNRSSNKLLGSGYQKKSALGDYVMGAALGPVFSTCSPTYFLILATVLPASVWLGTTYLLAYVAGLALVLFLIARLGERFAGRLAKVASDTGWLKRSIGVLLLVVAIFIMTGLDKQLETWVLDTGWFDITQVEYRISTWLGLSS
jgi:cytochrome c biogenesis protein CcdA